MITFLLRQRVADKPSTGLELLAATKREQVFRPVVVPNFLAQLREIPGIGNWTAQCLAMRALGEPDALPAGDLGLLHGLDVTKTRELAERAEAWRPWRSYATVYLWSTPLKAA